ncbi:MAG: hypothetical protein CMN15_06710 [Roseovarius sp.]|nr:hypothetical protein [Roseovarius sp.]
MVIAAGLGATGTVYVTTQKPDTANFQNAISPTLIAASSKPALQHSKAKKETGIAQYRYQSISQRRQ